MRKEFVITMTPGERKKYEKKCKETKEMTINLKYLK